MVDVERADLVAERAQNVPEAGRVGAAGDEAGDLAARRDQLVPADVGLDSLPKLALRVTSSTVFLEEHAPVGAARRMPIFS